MPSKPMRPWVPTHLCDWHISFFGWLTLFGRIKTANINEVLFMPLYLWASDSYAFALAPRENRRH